MFTSLTLSPRLLCLGLEKLSLSLGSMRMWLLMERCEVTPVTDRGGRRNRPTEPGLRCGLTLDLGQTVLEHSSLEAMCLVLSVRQPSVVGALVTGDRTEPPGWRLACGGQMCGEPSPTLTAPGRGLRSVCPSACPDARGQACLLCAVPTLAPGHAARVSCLTCCHR